MSEDKKVVDPETAMAGAYKDMKKTMTFFCIGWILFIYGSMLASPPGNMFLMLLGAAICAGPVMAILFFGGSFMGLFKADYEVVTTHSDGRKTSDGGAESRSNNLMVGLILACIAIFIGIVVQVIRFCIQTGKYLYYSRKVSQKPDFLHGGLFIIVIGFVVLIGAPSICGAISSVQKSMAESAREAAINAPLKGQMAKVINEIKLHEEANGQSKVVKKLQTSSKVMMTGENVNFWIPVEQDGAVGYVFGLNLVIKKEDVEVPAWKVGEEFMATASEDIKVSNYTGSKHTTLKKGMQVKASVNPPHLSYSDHYDVGQIWLTFEENNWRVDWDDFEKLQYVGPVK